MCGGINRCCCKTNRRSSRERWGKNCIGQMLYVFILLLTIRCNVVVGFSKSTFFASSLSPSPSRSQRLQRLPPLPPLPPASRYRRWVFCSAEFESNKNAVIRINRLSLSSVLISPPPPPCCCCCLTWWCCCWSCCAIGGVTFVRSPVFSSSLPSSTGLCRCNVVDTIDGEP